MSENDDRLLLQGFPHNRTAVFLRLQTKAIMGVPIAPRNVREKFNAQKVLSQDDLGIIGIFEFAENVGEPALPPIPAKGNDAWVKIDEGKVCGIEMMK
jgi:hypothetical protein